MGIREGFLAKIAAMKQSAAAQEAPLLSGRPAKWLTAEELAKGHPKVSAEVGFKSTVYETRLGSCFGWFWLAFGGVHGAAMFYGLSHGTVKIGGARVVHADGWHYFLLGLFYVPFLLIGFAFTVARYRVTLTPGAVVVRWRVLPYVGWTWTLPVGTEVSVSLACRGSEQDHKPLESVVVSSCGREIDFGAFLAVDVKEHLASAIRLFYAGEAGCGTGAGLS
jgi:hypothetical protein